MAETAEERDIRLMKDETPQETAARHKLELEKATGDAKAAELLTQFGAVKTDTASKDTSKYKNLVKLTPASARALMEQEAKATGYPLKFSDADVSSFIAEFDKKSAQQLDEVIKVAQSNTKVGAKPEDLVTSVNSLLTTTYLNYFKPEVFAKDFIWAKTNFEDVKTLGPKSLTALSDVRALIKNYNLLGVTDKEAQIAAKAIAMGTMSLADYKVTLNKVAIKEYPQLADRFANNPDLTVKDIASPIINMLAKEWEMDPSTIGFDEPIVAEYLRPGGADGKAAPATYTELLRKAQASPKWQTTTKANELARDSATSLARAFGFGV
jgi:hypothetical protein